MYALSYKGTDRIHSVIAGPPDPTNYDRTKLDAVEIPDQDTRHLYRQDDDGMIEMDGSLSDLVQYTEEEKDKTPTAARKKLKERGPIDGEKTIANLRERMDLIEQIIGV